MKREAQPVSVESACVPNISERGRRRRLITGTFWLGVSIAALVLLALRHAAWTASLVMAPLTFYTALFFFQAKEKT